MSERFHLAITAGGALTIVLAVLLAPQALRGDFLATLLLVTAAVVLAVVLATEFTAPRSLVVRDDTICVRSLVGKTCVLSRDVEDVHVEHAPLWRGGDRIVVQSKSGDLALPVAHDALERLSGLAHAR